MARPAPGRVSQPAAGYQRGYPLRSCGTCLNYWHREHGTAFGGCTRVAGNISPYGICVKFFDPIRNPFGSLTREDRHALGRAYDELHARTHGRGV